MMKIHVNYKVIFLVAVSIFSLPQPSNCVYVNPNFSTNVDLYENATIGTVVTNITDKRPGSNSQIVEVNYMGSDHDFYIRPGNGVWSVILNTTLDYDQGFTMRRLPIQASGSVTVNPSDIFITLLVQDVNDNAPLFLQQPYNAEVDEDAPAGTTVYTNIAAHDIDTSRGGTFTFQLLDVSEGQRSKFFIDRIHGIVTLNGSLDYESRTFYHYKVVAKDEGFPSLNSTTDLFITVKDVQDSPPVFTNRPYVTSVQENTPVNDSVLMLKAVDQDRAIPNTVAYNITNSTCPDLFQLDATSGEISVARALDSDVPPLKNLSGLCVITVQATEQNGAYPQKGKFTAVATATITVTDVNDNAPTFSRNSFSANISENSPAGTPLQLYPGQQITVSDIDEGSNSEIQLSLESGADTFELVTSRLQSSGSVLLRVKNSTSLDFETLPSLVVQINASDSDPSHAAVTATVTVTVVNVNEYSPEFGQHAYTASVLEGSDPGTQADFTTSISATDEDGGNLGTNSITYSLTNDRGLFRIDSTSGSVSVMSNQTDREREDRYYMVVVATDGGGLQQTVPLTINITDRNDNPPIFLRDQYDVILDEGATNFSHSASVKLEATDADEEGTANSDVTYSIDSTSPARVGSHFHLDPVSGRLSVTSALDYDVLQFPQTSAGTVKLVVVAKDNGSTRLSASVTVAVTLNDINDNGPSFQDTPYSTSIPEHSNAGFFVFQVNASDQDGSSPNNVITYSIESGGQDRFRINPDNGNITVSGDIDREQVQNYTLVVIARDRAASPKSNSTHVRIDITDVNDELPTFGDKGDVRVDANETFRGVLYTMSATDADSNSHLQYSILYNESSGQSGTFQTLSPSEIQSLVTINRTNGQISAASPLNRTVVQKLVLRVQVIDTNGTVKTPQIQAATLTITVVDINNQSPQFYPQGTVNATIRENMGRGTALTFISPFRVTDLDEGENSLFEVHVVGQNAADFEVVPSNVQSSADLVVKVKNGSLLDYEHRTHLSIKLLACETHTAEKRNSTVTITVSIEDENDNSPRFNASSYNVSIKENEPTGTTVTTVHATDDDRSSEFNTVTYSLQGAAGLFSINSSSGEVTVSRQEWLDYETRKKYQLTVEATDTGGLRDSVPLTVTLLDVNDNAPQFLRPEYRAFVKENRLDFDGDILITATDKDGDSNNEIRYSISPSSELASNFTVNSTTGRLGLSGSSGLDFEALPNKNSGVVQLIIVASDNGQPSLSSNVSVLVTVADLNDMDPNYSQDLYTANITENAPEGTILTSQVSASDGDGSAPNNVVFYVLDSGKGSDKFRVNSTTGVVTVGTGAVLDREADASFNLRLLAFDRGDPPRSSSTTLSVSLVDVNDKGPVFADARKEVSVYENASVSQEVELMNASDSDTDPDLVYTWLLGDSQATTDRDVEVNISQVAGWFRVDPDTGRVTVSGMLDREVAEVVVLKILVNDTKGTENTPQTAVATLTVTLLDVNDNAPEIIGSDTMSVSEALAVGTEVYSLTAHDEDKDQSVVFSMLTGTGAHFNVSANGKIFLQNQIDREVTPTVSFTVIATDSGSPPLSSNITFNVTVLDANDNDPKFQNTSYVFSVPEDAGIQTVVAIVNATDADEGPNADVTFDLADNVYDFVINTTTGAILVNKKLDREVKPSYTFGVAALDNPTTDERRRTIQQITIEVQDVNDNPPVLTQLDYVGEIDETKEPGQKVLNMEPGAVQATDADLGQNANLSFHMTSQGDVQFFTMYPRSGEVFVNTSISGQAGTYNYTVTVVDHGQPSLNASANLTIKIIDKNINTPRFVGNYTNIHVAECVTVGASITTFKAEDDDRDKNTNGKVQFFLDNATFNAADLQYFRLDKDTGELFSTKQFDRETRAHFHIGIRAQDKGLPTPLSATLPRVPITISDVNDQIPTFNTTRYDFSVRENQDNVLVGTVYAEDLDDYKRTCYGLVGDLNDHFNITAATDRPAEIRLIRPLDREVPRQASVSLTVTAYDCTQTASSGCDKQTGRTVSSTATVQVTVSDVNDNPPNFTKPLLTFGVASTADTGHVIVNLQEYVTDPDTGPNRVHAFYPVSDYELDKDLKPSFGPSDTPLAVTTNGTVATHAALPGDARGFFTWEIMVNDTAGNDTVILKIYVVGKDKLLRLTFFLSMEELRKNQDDILRDLSEQTGLLFVADDRVQFEDNKGTVDPSKSVLVVHAVKNKKDVMDANALWDFLDHEVAVTERMKNMYKLYSIQTLKAAEAKTADKTKMEYILAAIICVLVVAFCITLYIMLNNIRRFKRKLKAATIETYAMAGQQKEAFPGLKTPQTNPIFGKDEDLPGKDFDNDSASEQSDDSLDQNSVDFDAVRAEPGDDEREVTLDLYGEDTDQPPNLHTDGHYLDEALAEHERSKNPGAAKVHMNGVGPKQNGAPPRVLLQDIDVDLQGLEATEI